jgi:hypothetical protein
MSQAAVISLAKLAEEHGHKLGAFNHRPKCHLSCQGLSRAATSFWMLVSDIKQASWGQRWAGFKRI